MTKGKKLKSVLMLEIRPPLEIFKLIPTLIDQ